LCVFQIKADVLHRLTECREWMVSTPLKREVAVAYCFFNLVKSLIFLTADFEYIGKKKSKLLRLRTLGIDVFYFGT
jgi:hypothetical protein